MMSLDYMPDYNYWIHRPRIDTMLDKAIAYSAVSIVAPPGYGKSLAVAQFCRTTEHCTIWKRCLKLDNKTDLFWRSFASEIINAIPECEQMLKPLGFPKEEEELDAFLSAIHAIPKRQKIIFVFDKMENLDNRDVLNFIGTLIEADLANLCVILIGNQRYSTAPVFRSSKRLHISGDSLAFTRDEAFELSQKYGLNLSKQEVSLTISNTEGFPLVLHLLFTENFYTSKEKYEYDMLTHMTFELFNEQYFLCYPYKIRRLLIAFSLLPSMPLSIGQIIGFNQAQEAQQILSKNLFIKYNPAENCYTLHKMYARFLFARRIAFSQSEVTDIIEKAGKWYLDQGRTFDALECFWINRDYDNYIKAIAERQQEYLDTETASKILSRLNRFPVSYSANHIVVDCCRGYMHLNNLQVRKAKLIFENLLLRLEESPQDQEQRAMLGHIYIAMGSIANLTNTLEGLAYLKKAVALMPFWRPFYTRQLLVIQNNDTFALPDNQPGRLEEMIEYQNELAQYCEVHFGRIWLSEYLFAAEACLFSGQFQRASEYAQKGIYKAQLQNQYDFVCNALLVKMRISLFAGDLNSAFAYLGEIEECTRINDFLPLQAIRDCATVWLYTSIGHTEQISQKISEFISTMKARTTSIERTYIVLTDYLISQNQYHDALSVLIQADNLEQECVFWSNRINMHLLKAICYFSIGQENLALDEFWTAYDQTHQNNLWVMFAERGKYVLPLLQLAGKQDRYTFDPQWIDMIGRESDRNVKKKIAIHKAFGEKKISSYTNQCTLTAREMDVLSYLANGATRDEIAAVLQITVHGVKKHISNIYTKLGATNRVEALHIATMTGLLDEIEV